MLSQHKSHNIFYQFKHSLMNATQKQYFKTGKMLWLLKIIVINSKDNHHVEK